MVDQECRGLEDHNAERRNRTAPGARVEQLPTNPSEESSRRVSGQQPQRPPVVLCSTVKEWYQISWVPKHSATQLALLSHLSHQSDGYTAPEQVSSANPYDSLEESSKEHLYRRVYEQWVDVSTVVGVSNSHEQGQDEVEPMKLHLPTDSGEKNSSRMVPEQPPHSPLVIYTDSGTKFVTCEAQNFEEVVQRLIGKDWVQNDGVQEPSEPAKFTRPSHSSHQQLELTREKHYQGHLFVSLRATKRRARLSRMAPSYEGLATIS